MHWALLEIESLPNPKLPYPAAHYSLSHGSNIPTSSVRLSRPPFYRVEPNLSPLAHPTCRWVWPPVISPLPDAMELEDVPLPQTLWDQLSEHQ